MKKIILAPDSFKGTLSAIEICEIETEIIKRHIPNVEVVSIPMADGGEGMVDSYVSMIGGNFITAEVTGPLGDLVTVKYAILPDGSAVMEMAAAAGLPLVAGQENPLLTSTYGVGEMILHCHELGVKKILMGLGGSCTNECGIGIVAALGFKFLDSVGN